MKKIIFSQVATTYLTSYKMVNGELILDDVEKLRELLLEDVPYLKNEKENILIERIKRYKKIVIELKIKCNCKCQLCGFTFKKKSGENYAEAHHIVRLADNGSQNENNVIILCANHHRMIHYAEDIKYIFDEALLKEVRINGERYLVERSQ